MTTTGRLEGGCEPLLGTSDGELQEHAASVDLSSQLGHTRAVDSSVLQTSAPALLNCWERAWSRCGLHFESRQSERKFSQYSRNDRFFAALRWPFLWLSLCYVASLVVSIATRKSAPHRSTAHLVLRGLADMLNAVLFGVAWALSTWRCSRAHRPTIIASAAIVQVLAFSSVAVYTTQFAPDFQPGFTNFTTGLPGMQYFPPVDSRWIGGVMRGISPGEGVCVGNSTLTHDVHVDAVLLWQKDVGALQFFMSYGLFFFDVMMVPVVFLLLNLPFRLYVAVLAVPASTAVFVMGSAISTQLSVGNITGLQPQLMGLFNLGVFRVAGVVVFASCIAGALSQEHAWRSLFVLHAALRAQSQTLTRDAAYRNVVDANRSMFAVGGKEWRPARKHLHVTRAATN